MKRLLVFCCLLFSPALWAAELQTASFANGVKLIVEEDHSAAVAMVQIWLKVGGRDELPGKTGLAHVFEHMMFKGSQAMKPGAFSKRIAVMGGNDNAFTSHDYTAYFETIPSAQVLEVLAMEAERFAHLSLDADEFAHEIKVIMEERRMRTDDNPNARMFEELSATALRLSPYRNPVIGWMQDLQTLSIEDVRAFYQLHYVPANVTVVVVGDVSFAAVKKTIAASFGKMASKPVSPRFNPVEPEPLGEKSLTVHLAAQSPIVAITLPVPVWTPGQNDKEAAALAVLSEILAGGRSALLTHELVDVQRKAFAADAGYDPFGMRVDLWYAYGALSKTQDPQAFTKAFWALRDQLLAHGVSERALAAAKRRAVAAQVFAQDSLYLRAKTIGILETVGIGADQRDHWLALMKAVSANDIHDVIQRFLRPERATTGVLIPKESTS